MKVRSMNKLAMSICLVLGVATVEAQEVEEVVVVGTTVYESESNPKLKTNSTKHGLEYLDDAETFEPEFNEPKYIHNNEILSKLKILETSKFFDLILNLIRAISINQN